MEAALAIFADAGYAGARMDKIAGRAGVNKALIYYHIGDKKTLYAEVIHYLFGKTADTVEKRMAGAQTPVEKVRAYIRTLGRGILGEPYKASIILREFASGGAHFPEIVARDLKRIVGMLRAALEEGAEQGVFIETIPAAIHLIIVGAFNLYKTSAAFRQRHRIIEDIMVEVPEDMDDLLVDEVERLVLRAIRK